MLVYPGVTQLDFTAPAQMLASTGSIEVRCAWREKTALTTKSGFSILPSHSLDECSRVDILCVPGGGGCLSVMEDEAVLRWVRSVGLRARYVTSVCTGSLILGAAGLLEGYRATSHWAWRHYLPLFGAKALNERVVADRNRLTGGGVTAGLDMGLSLVAALFGDDIAAMTQLLLEYDPKPPMRAGNPTAAGPRLTALAQAADAKSAPARDERVRLAAAACRSLWTTEAP